MERPSRWLGRFFGIEHRWCGWGGCGIEFIWKIERDWGADHGGVGLIADRDTPP
jgi:hypothetical protein